MTVDYFVDLEHKEDSKSIDWVTTRYHRLISDGKKEEANNQRTDWSKISANIKLNEPDFKIWKQISKPEIDLTPLPTGSFWVQFIFTLASPYMSMADRPFYIIDNPIVRDKIFYLPMVRPTNWKGNLFSALWQSGHTKEKESPLQKLFGGVRAQEGGRAGRLFFYPTFFTQTSLEIINPHDRKRRVGRKPIMMESVPDGTNGVFTLLYVPFDLIGQEDAEIKCRVAEDMQLVAQGIQEMMLIYGFSAKRSNGYGAAKKGVKEGILKMRIEGTEVNKKFPLHQEDNTSLSLPKYLTALGKLKSEYLNADGTFLERSQDKLESLTKSQRQEYEKAKKWWEREGKVIVSEQESERNQAQSLQTTWLTLEFQDFDELVQKVSDISERLQVGDTL